MGRRDARGRDDERDKEGQRAAQRPSAAPGEERGGITSTEDDIKECHFTTVGWQRRPRHLGRVTPSCPLPAAMNHLLGRDLRDGIVAAGLRWRIVCIAEGIRTISCNLCNASPLILNTKLTDELPGHDSAMQPRRKKPRGAVTGESPGGLLVLAGLASSARHSVRPSAGWRRQQVECNRC